MGKTSRTPERLIPYPRKMATVLTAQKAPAAGWQGVRSFYIDFDLVFDSLKLVFTSSLDRLIGRIGTVVN